ncbi:hypothetical protein [Angelakisella massiliensis]|uniref:hypothetical protein n=1 Tax=Angelakisella massiliensis TaxID=1871018 RepID=UPI0024B149A2|nr:hypothetical protein [Angelakisella massiliensis]
MTLSDYEIQLDLVNQAISKILSGAQEYRIGTRTVRRADLSALLAERRRLEGIINQLAGGTTVARICRRG